MGKNQDKDRLLRKARRSGKEGDWIEAKRERHRVGRDIKNLRAHFLKRQQEANRADPKKFWKNIATEIPGKKGKQSRIWLTNKDNNSEVPSPLVANFINKFFTNIGPELAKKHNADWRYFGQMVDKSIDPFMTNLDEVT